MKHAIDTGAIRPGEQLPGIRPLAEELVVNPNTVARAYRELEHDGVIELRHGAGAFVSLHAGAKRLTDRLRAGQATVAAAVERLRARHHRRRDPAPLRGGTGGPHQGGRTPWLIPSSSRPFDLCKRYGSVEALQRLNLQVPAGSIFGLLGRNGAGKTTAMKILLGMTRPTSGRARAYPRS